jgi:hypothetical protein
VITTYKSLLSIDMRVLNQQKTYSEGMHFKMGMKIAFVLM